MKYYHSSLASGRDVLCAGEIVIRDGIIIFLNYKSGHYWPTKEHFIEFVVLLLRRGVLLPRSVVGEDLALLIENQYHVIFLDAPTQ